MKVSKHYIRDKANEIEKDDKVRVTYNSRRSEDKQTMEGEIVEVKWHDNLKIIFERSDGQRCFINDLGELVSVGSKFPVTGDILEIEILSPVPV